MRVEGLAPAGSSVRAGERVNIVGTVEHWDGTARIRATNVTAAER